MERRERFVVMSMSASQRLSRFEIPLRPERHLDRSKCSYLVRSGLLANSSNPTVWKAKTGPRRQKCYLWETTGSFVTESSGGMSWSHRPKYIRTAQSQRGLGLLSPQRLPHFSCTCFICGEGELLVPAAPVAAPVVLGVATATVTVTETRRTYS